MSEIDPATQINTEVEALRREVEQLTKERDAAVKELADRKAEIELACKVYTEYTTLKHYYGDDRGQSVLKAHTIMVEVDNKRVAAEQQVATLTAAIQKHHDQRADDRCWLDDLELYAVARLPTLAGDNRVGDKAAMLRNCERFIAKRCEGGGPWKSYAELEQANAALTKQLAEVSRRRDELTLELFTDAKRAMVAEQQVERLTQERDTAHAEIRGVKRFADWDCDDDRPADSAAAEILNKITQLTQELAKLFVERDEVRTQMAVVLTEQLAEAKRKEN